MNHLTYGFNQVRELNGFREDGLDANVGLTLIQLAAAFLDVDLQIGLLDALLPEFGNLRVCFVYGRLLGHHLLDERRHAVEAEFDLSLRLELGLEVHKFCDLLVWIFTVVPSILGHIVTEGCDDSRPQFRWLLDLLDFTRRKNNTHSLSLLLTAAIFLHNCSD